MAAGHFEEAIPICKELVRAVPGNAGLLLNLALAEHMAGHELESIPHFEAVLKSRPDSKPARASLGDAFMATGRFEQAAEQFRKLTDLDPDAAGAWFGLGKSYEAVSQAAFERLRKSEPQSPYISALIADTRVQRRQYRSAFFFYRESLKQLPELHGLHSALAEVYRKTGHSEWAAAEEAKERSLPPPDCSAHPAECQFLAGHDVQALAQKRAGMPSPETLYWQAKAANELALQAFLRLGQLPPSPEMHELKAEILDAQEKHLEAVEEWRAALALAPGSPKLEHELAVSLFLAKDYRAALEAATRFLKAHPGASEMDFMAGDSLLRLEQPDQAVPYLTAALKADPKMLAADASLGLALSRLGRNAEALPHLEKALELDDDGSLHYQLARAWQAAGQPDKARAAMAQYQEILKKGREQKAEVAREVEIAPPQ